MPRTYERKIPMPEVDVLDWELIEGLTELYERYRVGDSTVVYRAEDGRGAYREESLAQYRAELEAAHEPPGQMGVTLHGHTDHPALFFHVWWGDNRGAGFVSENEADVVYVAERAADLLRQAGERRESRLRIERANRVVPAGWLRLFFQNPWVVGVGTGLIIAGIIALITFLH